MMLYSMQYGNNIGFCLFLQCKTCDLCQRFEKIKTQAPELKSIKVNEPLELVGMDRSQLALNKTKKNNGVAGPTRKRQLVCKKVKAEKFPLAADREVVELKSKTMQDFKTVVEKGKG